MSSKGLRLNSAYQLGANTWITPRPWRAHESYPATSVVNNGLTADANGTLEVSVALIWQRDANNQARSVRLLRNGTVFGAISVVSTGTTQDATWTVPVSAGDELLIECRAVQTQGALRTLAIDSQLLAIEQLQPPLVVTTNALPIIELRASSVTLERTCQLCVDCRYRQQTDRGATR